MLHTISAFDRLGEENAFAVLARATALAQQGRDIVNLGIGQPDFKTPQHIVEAALAHINKDKVESAYNRGDLLRKRQKLMEAWSRFVTTPVPAGNVVSLKTKEKA